MLPSAAASVAPTDYRQPDPRKDVRVPDIARPRLLLLLLVIGTAMGPLAMQIFLPSLPSIQSDFAISGTAVQLVASLSIATIAVTMLIYGPLADRFGRRPIFIIGLLLFCLGSIMAVLAPSLGWLVAGRVVQAAGGAGTMTVARTIVRDLFSRERAAGVLAYITAAMIVAPMLAPVIGGYLDVLYGWRASFVLTAVVSAIIAVPVIARLPETAKESAPLPSPVAVGRVFVSLLRRAEFSGFAFQSAFGMAAFFAFAASAPYVVIVIMDVPAPTYGTFFIAVSVVFMSGNFLVGRYAERLGIERTVMAGSVIGLVGTALIPVSLMVFGLNPWALFAPMLLIALGNGLSMPNAMAGALSADPRNAGSASGLVGFIQMGMSALFAQLAGMWQNGTPWPMVGFMLVAATLSLWSFVASQRRRPTAPEAVHAD